MRSKSNLKSDIDFFLKENFPEVLAGDYSLLKNEFENNSRTYKIVVSQIIRRNLIEIGIEEDEFDISKAISEVKKNTDLIVPRPILSKKRFLLLILTVLAPIILFLTIMYFNVEIILLLSDLILPNLLLFLFSFYILIYLVNPKFFQPDKLSHVSTFNEFESELVILNLGLFKINDYEKTINYLKLMVNQE